MRLLHAQYEYNCWPISTCKLTVKAELHCHNIHSNFHVGKEEPPYDCSVTVVDQLEQARRSGLDAIFITNHNTLAGYAQTRAYCEDHARFRGIRVYPAEEITLDTGAHILAYGIHEEISAGMPLLDTIDAIKRQGAVSSAPHPFSLLDALRDDAIHCDIVEVFNSTNVDIISNICATEFAQTHSKPGVAGSDSHVVSTLGRCVNNINSQNTLDDILHSMKHGRVSIKQSDYASRSETLEHLRYKIRNSKEYLEEYIDTHYPQYSWVLRFLLRAYHSMPDSILWNVFYHLGVYLIGRVSARINLDGEDPSFMKERNLSAMLRMAI